MMNSPVRKRSTLRKKKNKRWKNEIVKRIGEDEMAGLPSPSTTTTTPHTRADKLGILR